MATAQWIGNALARSQVVTITVSAVAVGGTLNVTINGKTVTYTCVTGDTVAIATAALLALVSNTSTAPPEMNEQTWASPTSSTITATAQQAGVPFAGMAGGLTVSATGGAGISSATTTANSSPSDAADAKNWLRSGGQVATPVNQLPQDNDDLVIADTSVPILWNLDTALNNVRLASVTRWQSFTGTIGLPEVNPNGYYEYRATYLKLRGGGVSTASSSFSSPGGGTGGSLPVVLGFGQVGTGPTRERYDFQNQTFNLQVLAAGQPQDPASVRVLGTSAANAVTALVNTSLAIAMLPGEVATIASAVVGSGGVLFLGPGVTFNTSCTVNGGQLDLNCSVPTLLILNNAFVIQGRVAPASQTYNDVTVKNQSSLVWLSGSNIAGLTLQTGSNFQKQTQSAMTITSLSIEADTCTFSDLFNAVTFTNAVPLVNALTAGPFRFSAGKKFTIANA